MVGWASGGDGADMVHAKQVDWDHAVDHCRVCCKATSRSAVAKPGLHAGNSWDRQTHLKWSLVWPKNAGSPQEPARKARWSAGTELGWQHLPAHGRAGAECSPLTGCRRWWGWR